MGLSIHLSPIYLPVYLPIYRSIYLRIIPCTHGIWYVYSIHNFTYHGQNIHHKTAQPRIPRWWLTSAVQSSSLRSWLFNSLAALAAGYFLEEFKVISRSGVCSVFSGLCVWCALKMLGSLCSVPGLVPGVSLLLGAISIIQSWTHDWFILVSNSEFNLAHSSTNFNDLLIQSCLHVLNHSFMF